MSDDTVESIAKYLVRRAPALSRLSISWFGGEPLLAMPVVRSLSRRAMSICDEQGIQYHSAMTTNGYLLSNKILTELISLNVFDYQITLDGLAESHNKTRLSRMGKGTFERIWDNLVGMRSITSPLLKVTVRIHYSEESYEGIPPLLSALQKELGDDERFTFHLKTIENLGGPKASEIPKWTPGRRQEIHRQLSTLLPRPKVLRIKDYVCYAAKPNSIAIRSDGRIAKCTVDLHDPQNDLGKIDKDGYLQLDNQKLAHWLRGYLSGNDDELTCPAHTQYVAQKIIPIFAEEEV